jgi:ribonuclease P protein subunit POP4
MYEEYIGLLIEVTNSQNKSLIGKKGKIIDETMNLFIVEEFKDKIIKILKKGSTFTIDGKKVIGDKITKRPEDRVKLVKKV